MEMVGRGGQEFIYLTSMHFYAREGNGVLGVQALPVLIQRTTIACWGKKWR